MSEAITQTYGSSTIAEFWSFVEKLNYNSLTGNSESIKYKLLKTLSPQQSAKFRLIAEEYAKNLAGLFVSPNSTSFISILPAAYLAIERGRETYNLSLEKLTLPLNGIEIDQVPIINNFCNIFPTEDDYYYQIAPKDEDDLDDLEDFI